MENTKICSKCGRELSISEFHKDKSHKDGLRSECKECTSKRNKKYQADNREVILKEKKRYYLDNRETILKCARQRRIEHPEYIKQYCVSFRGYCARMRNNNILADKKYERIGDELPSNYPTIEDYMELLQLPDFYDGKQYDFTEMGLDRKDNSLPHILSNVVPCTTEHNKQRGTMAFEDFLAKFNNK